MFKFVLLLFTSVAVVLDAAPKNLTSFPDERIVGGEDADIKDFPYQVSVQYSGKHICGGIIISTTRVVTAAHCTNGVDASNLSIRANSSYRNSGGQTLAVKSISQHSNYDPRTIDYDVSVLILQTVLTFGSGVEKIALHPVNAESATDSTALASGWGTTSSGGSSPAILRKVTVNKIRDQDCNHAYGNKIITSRMVCFGASGKDSCQGDSGGPLVANGKLVGVVSWGYGCADPYYPGVYTKVAHPEIQKHITNSL